MSENGHNFQLFITNEGDCKKLLPISPLSSTITFHRVTTFAQKVDLSQLVDENEPPDQHPFYLTQGHLKLALPLHVLAPRLNEFTRPKVIFTPTPPGGGEKKSLFVGVDKAFLPGIDHFFGAGEHINEYIIDNPNLIQENAIERQGKHILLNSKVKEYLADYGEAYAPVKESNEKVKLVMKAKKVKLQDVKQSLMAAQQATQAPPNLSSPPSELDDEQYCVNLSSILADKRAGKNHRPSSALPPLHLTDIQYQQVFLQYRADPRFDTCFEQDDAKDDDKGDTSLPLSPPGELNDEQYCVNLSSILADKRAGKNHRPSSALPPLHLTDIQYQQVFLQYRADPRFDTCFEQDDAKDDDKGDTSLPLSPPGELNDEQYCVNLSSILADKRAGKNHRPSSALPPLHLTDLQYQQVFLQYRADPRFDACFEQDGVKDDNKGDTQLKRPKPQPPSYDLGIVTTYQQDWEMLGYSRGSLLSSITLAPQEEVQIEIFTWDRHKLEQEQSFGTEYEKIRKSTTCPARQAKLPPS